MAGVGELQPVIGMNDDVTAGLVYERLRVFLCNAVDCLHDFRHGSVKTDLGLQTTFGHRCYHRRVVAVSHHIAEEESYPVFRKIEIVVKVAADAIRGLAISSGD